MSGCRMSASPAVEPNPTMKLNTPGGRFASSSTSANFAPHSGVSEEGLNTTVQPATSAAPLFHPGIAIGKFHGVMRPTGPTGRRIEKEILVGDSEGTV